MTGYFQRVAEEQEDEYYRQQSLFPIDPELLSYEEVLNTDTTPMEGKTREDSPYLIVTKTIHTREAVYNPDFAGHRAGKEYSYGPNCGCGHPYTRHFDGYEDNRAVGCKYCDCYRFKLPRP